MNRQWTPTKAKGVHFFNHFPKNFLRPYAATEPAPSVDTIFGRLRPEVCEWYRRPETAMSELHSTLYENRPCLEQDEQLLNPTKMQELLADLLPITAMLAKFHKDSTVFKTNEDSREVILQMIDTTPELLSRLKACVHIGGALFSTGIQYLVAHAQLTNPDRLAANMSFAPNPDPPFKQSKDYEDLFPLLYINKNAPPETPTTDGDHLSTMRERLLRNTPQSRSNPRQRSAPPPHNTQQRTPTMPTPANRPYSTSGQPQRNAPHTVS